jgi:DNA-binding transcriptional MocR family regulator
VSIDGEVYIHLGANGMVVARTKITSIGEILGNWALRRGPLYRNLALALQEAITRGDLPPGTAIPSERELAETLAVSRTTVIGAMQLLKDEGWLAAQRGSGTWVKQRGGSSEEGQTDPIRSLRGNPSIRNEPASTVDLATLVVPPSQTVIDAIAGINKTEAAELAIATSYSPTGLPILRKAIASHLTDTGLETDPAQVLVTTGSQQAISLVAQHLLRDTDSFVVENPTSPGALDALRATGARAYGTRVIASGQALESLEVLLSHVSPACYYTMPTFHSPTGSIMPVAARRRLARHSDRLQLPIIEDLSHSWLALEEDRPIPIASIAEGDSVIVVDSMSKVLWSGLRIGYIRANEGLIYRLRRAKTLADLGTPHLSQLVAARLLGHIGELLLERRQVLARRLATASDLITTLLPDWSFIRPRGGIALWLELPSGSARGFAQYALRHGVAVVAGPLLSVDNEFDDHIRLSYGVSSQDLEIGLRRLAAAWDSYRLSERPYSTLPEVIL